MERVGECKNLYIAMHHLIGVNKRQYKDGGLLVEDLFCNGTCVVELSAPLFTSSILCYFELFVISFLL